MNHRLRTVLLTVLMLTSGWAAAGTMDNQANTQDGTGSTSQENNDCCTDPYTPEEAAYDLYWNVSDSLLVERTSDPAFAEAFPDYQLYNVHNTTWHPHRVHRMAWDADDEEAFDLTHGFNNLTDDAGMTIVTANDAVTYARAYAHNANTELQQQRQNVTGDDSEWVGAPTEDVTATKTLNQWIVELDTYSEINGVVADWTINFTLETDGSDRIDRAEWKIREYGTGPYETELGAPILRPGFKIVNEHSAGSFTLNLADTSEEEIKDLLGPWELDERETSVVQERLAFDNMTTRVTHAAPVDALPDATKNLTTMVADAANNSYSRIVHESLEGTRSGCENETNPDPNWGFEFREAQCTLDIQIVPPRGLSTVDGQVDEPAAATCGTCVIAKQADCQGTFLVASDIESLFVEFKGLYDPGLPSYSTDALVDSLVSHELFHKLQCDEMNPETRDTVEKPPTFLKEGTARVVQTFFSSDLEHQSASSYFSTAGANGLLETPWRGPCGMEMDYEVAGFWGYYIARTTKSSAAFEAILEDARDPTGECADDLQSAVDHGLTVHNASQTNTSQLVANLSIDLLARENMQWAGEDWGEYLETPVSEAITDENQTGDPFESMDQSTDDDIEPWGIHYFRIDDTVPELQGETITIGCSENPLGDWSIQVVNLEEGSANDTLWLENQPGNVTNCQTQNVTVDLATVDETYIAAARQAATPGTYEVEVQLS